MIYLCVSHLAFALKHLGVFSPICLNISFAFLSFRSADMSTYRSAISTPNRPDNTPNRSPLDANLPVTMNNSGDREFEMK